jgi:hypothetical protein
MTRSPLRLLLSARTAIVRFLDFFSTWPPPHSPSAVDHRAVDSPPRPFSSHTITSSSFAVIPWSSPAPPSCPWAPHPPRRRAPPSPPPRVAVVPTPPVNPDHHITPSKVRASPLVLPGRFPLAAGDHRRRNLAGKTRLFFPSEPRTRLQWFKSF